MSPNLPGPRPEPAGPGAADSSDAAVASGVVDRAKVGLQGHSWGGYQTSFLITQTGAFAAAVAGAPLTNMISMYSSIYGASGSANQPIFESSQGRFAGGAYHPVLRRVDAFLAAGLPKALETRRARAARLLELEEKVNVAVAGLKEQGFTSPYLKAFVVARLNPLRFRRGATMEFDEALDAMLKAAGRFDPKKIKLGDLAGTFGPAAEE